VADVRILRVGKWEVARHILHSLPHRFEKAVDEGIAQEAHFMRGKVVEGLREQAPGGQTFKPLVESTIAKRQLLRFRGTKALIVRGDLARSITVQRQPSGSYFVGVLRTARGRLGSPLANVAELNEFGSRPIAIRITPKMRRFLAMLGHMTGHEPSEDGGGTGIVVVQIPARPFMRPVAEKYFGDRDAVAQRFLGRISRSLAGDLGTP